MKNILNVFKIILIGSTVGVTVLMLAYLGVYYIAGNEVFVQEISNLEQVKILQSQFAIIACIGGLLSLNVYIVESVRSCKKQPAYKLTGAMLLLIISFVITNLIVEYIGTFSENISNMIVIIEVVAFAGYCLIRIVKEGIDQFIINKKLKEQNQ